ncbi:DUF1707 domain-containing protein [Mycobacterium sp. ITM-2016-00318]|uniref:DUF1707 SHOCT-like domain-containing protein n=1 Tax=Mycobacterium sp. ITM-2016-00318 TaxID=2099693 RepID=UPI001304AD86|nr:DUF1707 domain-containing protein [Mycobacterium sp. ITM-2016-00318]WNG92896.1 DUF1707 domain-containing protein [Mycobacterium sp. ITM-2016-00318]
MATGRPGGTRTKDSDRTATCQILDSAFAEGQLSMEEHRQRVNAATTAATPGELESLVADLQTAGALQPFATGPRSGRGPLVIAGMTVAAVVVLAAVAVVLMNNDSSSSDTTTSSPSAAAPETHELAAEPSTRAVESAQAPADPPPVVLRPLPDLHAAEGLTLVLDEIRNRFGDTMGYELAITPDEATLARPAPTHEQSKLIYSFHRGWGDPSTRPRSDTDDLTDLAAFDVPAAAAALQPAPGTLRIARGDVTETFIDIDHIAEPPGPGALELLVRVSTRAHTDGWIYLDSAGTVKRVEDPS